MEEDRRKIELRIEERKCVGIGMEKKSRNDLEKKL